MKANELRPCDLCGGAIAPLFYRIDVTLAAIRAEAVNRLIGTTQIRGGGPAAMRVADALAGEEVTEELTEGCSRLLVCQTCLLERTGGLPEAIDRFRAGEATRKG